MGEHMLTGETLASSPHPYVFKIHKQIKSSVFSQKNINKKNRKYCDLWAKQDSQKGKSRMIRINVIIE